MTDQRSQSQDPEDDESVKAVWMDGAADSASAPDDDKDAGLDEHTRSLIQQQRHYYQMVHTINEPVSAGGFACLYHKRSRGVGIKETALGCNSELGGKLYFTEVLHGTTGVCRLLLRCLLTAVDPSDT